MNQQASPEAGTSAGPQEAVALNATGGTVAQQDPTAGAKKIPGMFEVLKKGGQAWLSIKKDQLNKPFFFSANVSKSLGEKWLTGSTMGSSQLAEFRQVDDMVQLVALHTENFAKEGSYEEGFVDDGFTDSLISSAPSTPTGPDSEELLIDARVLLYKDIAGYQGRLQSTYKTAFQQDIANTSFSQIDNSDKQTSFGVQAHFEAPTSSNGSYPRTAPVANSVMTEFRYNFLQLPEEPMTPRIADERVGHFVTTRKDYSTTTGDGKVHYVNRWRLEKADPEAEMSKPKEPITFWMSNDVPKEYRRAVKEGILEWNKAFEAIGFENAIEVKQQRIDQKFSTMDARHASVNWYTAADAGAAVGPSHVDPRTGEILDADIRMADLFGRSAKRFFEQNVADKAPTGLTHAHAHGHLHDGHNHSCDYHDHAATEHEFASGLLEARGNTAASRKLARAYVKDVVMHEVGHTLGLRHNFKASTAFTAEQLQDKAFTKEHGLATSVMDYLPFNLAGPDEEQGEFVMSSLGAYDYHAIKYAYAELSPDEEAHVLDEIAALTTTEPGLAYGTDEAADHTDPEISRFDMSKNPLGYAKKQVVLAQELWDRAQTQELDEGESYRKLSKAFSAGLGKVRNASTLAARYVGGTHINRVRAGDDESVYEPVPAEKQREAVNFLMGSLFQPDSFQFDPGFIANLAKDRFGNWGDQNIHTGKSITGVQSSALKQLLSPDRAQRIIDNPEKLPADADSYSLGELYQNLQDNIWSELSTGAEASQSRRDLQRVYLDAISDIAGPKSSAPGEARSMMRYLSKGLEKKIETALQGEMSLENRAHLDDCRQNIHDMLNPNK